MKKALSFIYVYEFLDIWRFGRADNPQKIHVITTGVIGFCGRV